MTRMLSVPAEPACHTCRKYAENVWIQVASAYSTEKAREKVVAIMPRSGRFMHELQAKVNIIAEVLYRKGVCGNNSVRQLAITAEIKPSTLDKSLKENKITPKVEEKLLKCAGFDPGEICWYDPRISNKDRYLPASQYNGKDKVENFQKYFHELHGLSAVPFRRAVPQRPAHRDENVVTFTLENSGQDVQDDQPLLLFFRVVIKAGHYDRISYGFNKVMLRFVPPFGNISFSEILSANKSVRINNAVLKAHGGQFNPEWFLSLEGNILNGEYRTTEPICGLLNAKVGDVLTAEIYIHQHDGYLVSRETGKELEDPAKQAVLAALCARELTTSRSTKPSSLPPNDEGGWITLGRQLINIVRGDD